MYFKEMLPSYTLNRIFSKILETHTPGRDFFNSTVCLLARLRRLWGSPNYFFFFKRAHNLVLCEVYTQILKIFLPSLILKSMYPTSNLKKLKIHRLLFCKKSTCRNSTYRQPYKSYKLKKNKGLKSDHSLQFTSLISLTQSLTPCSTTWWLLAGA